MPPHNKVEHRINMIIKVILVWLLLYDILCLVLVFKVVQLGINEQILAFHHSLTLAKKRSHLAFCTTQ